MSQFIQFNSVNQSINQLVLLDISKTSHEQRNSEIVSKPLPPPPHHLWNFLITLSSDRRYDNLVAYPIAYRPTYLQTGSQTDRQTNLQDFSVSKIATLPPSNARPTFLYHHRFCLLFSASRLLPPLSVLVAPALIPHGSVFVLVDKSLSKILSRKLAYQADSLVSPIIRLFLFILF